MRSALVATGLLQKHGNIKLFLLVGKFHCPDFLGKGTPESGEKAFHMGQILRRDNKKSPHLLWVNHTIGGKLYLTRCVAEVPSSLNVEGPWIPQKKILGAGAKVPWPIGAGVYGMLINT